MIKKVIFDYDIVAHFTNYQSMKKTRIITVYLVLLLTWLSGSSFLSDTFIKEFVEGFNKSCPIKSGGTTIESAEALPNKMIKFNVFISKEMDEYQEYFMSKLFASAVDAQQVALISSESFQTMREMSVRFLFAYHTKEGKEISRKIIEPEEYNNYEADTILKGELEVINHTINEIKKQLPIVEPTTGITILDAYFSDSTMTYVGILPDMYIEEVVDPIGKEVFKLFQFNNLRTQSHISKLLSSGYSFNYVYLKENAEEYIRISITSEILKNELQEEEQNQLMAKMSAYTAAYVINREVEELSEDEGVKVEGAYVEGDTLFSSYILPDDLLVDLDKDAFFTVLYPAMRESVVEEPELLSMIQNGIYITYIYKEENGELFQTIAFSPDDFLDLEEDKSVESVEEKLAALIQMIKPRLPYSDDSGFELQDFYEEDGTLIMQIYYGEEVVEEELSEDVLEEVTRSMKSIVKQFPFMEEIIAAGYAFKVVVNDKEGKPLIEEMIRADDL